MNTTNNKKGFVRLFVYILVSVASVIIDIFFFNEILFPHLDTLVTTCFSSLISISSIWIGCYLLFLELFRDRYQLQLLKKNYYGTMKKVFIFTIFCLLFGIFVMIIPLGPASAIIFCAISIGTIIEILIKIFQSNKTLMINSHIDKQQEDLERKIKSGIILSSEELKDYSYLFDECIIKGEYYTIQNIVEKSGDLFRTFLKNSIGTLSPEDLEKSFESILKFNCLQLNFCKTIKSELLIIKILKQQYANLEFCIDYNQTEWYKRYLDELKIFLVSKKETTFQSEFVADLFYYMNKIVLYIISKKKDELAEYTINTIQNHISNIKFIYKDFEIDNFAIYNSLMLEKCQKEGNDIWFVKISNSLNDFLKNLYIKDISFHAVKSCYALIFNYYCKKNKNQALSFCEDSIEIFSFDINDAQFTSFKYFAINELYDLCENDLDFRKKVFTLHIEILNRSISIKNKPNTILLPELDTLILNGNPLAETRKEYLDEFMSLLNTCIIEDEAIHFYKLLCCINDVLIKTTKQQKDIQIELINIYMWAINRTKNLANKNFYKISFELLEKAIHDMDKERIISENLGTYIIDILSDFARNPNINNHEIINLSIDLLRNFSSNEETLYFILQYPSKKTQLHRALFNIGTSCIENNYEEGARRISNTIGWSIISCIKQSSADSANYLIDRAIDLYDISVKMKTSITTQTFIATLFTTIGAYCCKEAKLYAFRTRIIQKLNVSLETLETAAKLRTEENDVWNDLLEGKTKDLTNTFLTAYRERHS